jgi:hypothetical protein
MKARTLGPAMLLALAVLGWPNLASPLRAQVPKIPFGADDHFFRFVLEQLSLQPITDVEDLARDPSHSLVIVLGDVSPLEEIPGGIVPFIQAGGAALIASDRAIPERLEDALGVRITGALVSVRANEVSAYRGLAECPIATPTPGTLLLAGLDAIATNKPSYLFSHNDRLSVLAALPEDYLVTGPSYSGSGIAGPLPFAAGGDWGKGRVLVLSDHSVFINEMMMPDDNANFQLAYNAVQWLSADGERKRAFFTNEGRTIDDFQGVFAELSKPPVPPLEIVNRMVAGMEDDDFFNRLLLANWSIWRVFRGAAVALAAAVLILGLHRLSGSRQRSEPDSPAAPENDAVLIPAVGLVDLRHQAMIDEGNLWEGARGLCRHCFQSLGIPRPPPEASETELVLPHVTIQGSWRQRGNLRDLTWRIWDLAYGKPRRVSARQFSRLLPQIAELQTAIQSGRVHLDSPEIKA